MTKVSSGIHPDILRVNRIRVRGQFSQALCDAFLFEARRSGITLQEVADRLEIDVDVLLRRIADAGMGRINHVADIALGLGYDLTIRLVPMEADPKDDEIEEQRLNYEGAMADLDAVLDVLVRRINGEADLASAAEWLRMNYPEKAQALKP